MRELFTISRSYISFSHPFLIKHSNIKSRSGGFSKFMQTINCKYIVGAVVNTCHKNLHHFFFFTGLLGDLGRQLGFIPNIIQCLTFHAFLLVCSVVAVVLSVLTSTAYPHAHHITRLGASSSHSFLTSFFPTQASKPSPSVGSLEVQIEI